MNCAGFCSNGEECFNDLEGTETIYTHVHSGRVAEYVYTGCVILIIL